MKELSLIEVTQVSAGIQVRLGTLIAAVVIGAMTGGTGGISYAIASTIMAEGIDNLADMANQYASK